MHRARRVVELVIDSLRFGRRCAARATRRGRRGIVSSPHGLRPRSLRRHRRPDVAKADAGAVPGVAPRQAARRRPHPRRLAPGAQRRRLSRLAEGALPRGRGRQAAERRGVRPLRRAPPLPAPGPLASRATTQRLKAWLASPIGRAEPADVVVMYLATSPDLFPVDLRAARRRRPERRERPRRAREAARPRPGERAGDQPRRALGVRRGAGLPHRPLPRQALGAEPDGAALRQRAVRAALAARVHRQHPDHDRRDARRRHARRLLQPHRRAARHDPEPRAAAADDGGDGAAVAHATPTRSATRS